MIEKLFEKQFRNGIIAIVLGVILSHIFKNGIFSNIAWVFYGLLYVVHPVDLHSRPLTPKGAVAVRIAGAVIVLLGIVTRFGA